MSKNKKYNNIKSLKKNGCVKTLNFFEQRSRSLDGLFGSSRRNKNARNDEKIDNARLFSIAFSRSLDSKMINTQHLDPLTTTRCLSIVDLFDLFAQQKFEMIAKDKRQVRVSLL